MTIFETISTVIMGFLAMAALWGTIKISKLETVSGKLARDIAILKDLVRARTNALKAIRRPRYPISVIETDDIKRVGICPNCGALVNDSELECDCGQVLDWSK